MTGSAEPPRFATLSAEVVAFDEAAGWGTLRSVAGDEFFFHCTQIADGTRTIPVGAPVQTRLAPIGLGVWEATDVRAAGGV